MPELPDVEVFRRDVDATSLHKRIEHVHVFDESLLTEVSRQKIAAALTGETIDRTDRHGKHLGLHSSGGAWLVLHFGMTGAIRHHDGGAPDYAALVLELSGSTLTYTSRRRLGRITLTDDFDRFVREEKELGEDAMVLELDEWRQLASDRTARVKSLLMDQQTIAGIGNVYADEMLFQAGVHPERRSRSLSDKETGVLHRSMRHVLRTAVRHRAQPDEMPRSWLLPRREKGAECPRCGGRVAKKTVGGRATYFCNKCQR